MELSCSQIAQPMVESCFWNSSRVSFVLKPGMEAILSSTVRTKSSSGLVMPGTTTPQAAPTAARISEVLSPTPPVEYFATFGLVMWERSRVSPVRIISSAKTAVSCAAISLK